ncbi:MAG: hypothetical protein JWQ74_344 [Marmoricola sp.]|nr:hypothetical protein [Marmoricola sp.]
MSNTLVRRLGALVAASALTATGITLVAAPANAVAVPRPVTQGANWLAGQLTNGLLHSPNYSASGYDDYGLSIDAAFALDAVGGHADDVKAIGKAIRDNYYNYITPSLDFGDNALYGGAVAKALVLAQVAGTGPSSYLATLRSDLEKQVADAAPIAGRVQNSDETVYLPPNFEPTPGDSANVISQGLTARALTAAGSTEAAAAVDFLLDQQCAAGFFREQFNVDKASPDQSCNSASPAATASIDATSQAVINLSALPATPAITDALAAARTWLKAQQASDGSFNGDNSNSTGLAASAVGASPEATKAAAFLRDHQADDTDACTALRDDVGAIAFTSAALGSGRTAGIPTIRDDTSQVQDQWRRATTQALPALEFLAVPEADALALSGPARFVLAGSTASYRVSGSSSANRLCVSTPGASKIGTASGSGAATVALKLPVGPATRTVTVTDRDGNTDSVLTKVLAAKTLTVKPTTNKVTRGKTVKVTVSGLAAGEHVTLRYQGVVILSNATATSTGTYVKTVAVGTKLGSASFAALGEFGVRKGVATITVVK